MVNLLIFLPLFKLSLRYVCLSTSDVNHPHIHAQELLEDLQRKFSVVREQSSWGNDTNPFCCDRCWQSSPLLPERGRTTTTVASPTDDPHSQNNANTGEGADGPAYGRGGNFPHNSALDGEGQEETSAFGENGSRLGNDEKDCGGHASYNDISSGAEGENHPPPRTFPTAAVSGSLEEKKEAEVRGGGAAVCLMPTTPVNPATFLSGREEAEMRPLTVGTSGVEMQGSERAGAGQPPPSRRPEAVAAAFSAHLHGVDKNPLELARLCRFAQFLTENELLREAYEVSL